MARVPAFRCPCGTIAPRRCLFCGGNMQHEDTDLHACLLCSRPWEGSDLWNRLHPREARRLPLVPESELDYRADETEPLAKFGRRGFSVKEAQAVLGHTSRSTTRRTIHRLVAEGAVRKLRTRGVGMRYQVVRA